MLIPLVSMQWIQTLQSIVVTDIDFGDNIISIPIYKLLKHTHPGKFDPVI